MSDNSKKAAAAGIILLLALGLFLWNSGIIGAGGSASPAPLSAQDSAEQNQGATPGKSPATLGGLTPEPHM